MAIYKENPYLLTDKEAFELEKIEKEKAIKKQLNRLFCEENALKNYLDLFTEGKTDLKKVGKINVFENNLITGSFGVGKTYSALYNAYRAVRNGSLTGFKYCIFYNVFEQKYRINGGFEKLKSAQVLIIDEFCTLKTINREDVNLVIHELLEARAQRGLKTTLITNVNKTVFEKPNPLEGSIISRLKTFKINFFAGNDLRGRE